MAKHADEEPVMFGYAASCNISFRSQYGGQESGYTWGGWREMSDRERDEAYNEFVWNELGMEVYVEDDEE